MRFAAFSLLATIASAAFSYAAPVTSAATSLEARHNSCNCHGIHGVIGTLTNSLTPVLAELTYIKKDNCTAEILTPILGEVKDILNTAIEDVKGLVGITLTTVLTTVDGVLLTVADVAQLVCGLLNLIFGAIALVLKIVSAAEAKLIFPLLCDVLKLVAVLLQLICQIVGGLLAILLPLVGDVVFTVISALGLTTDFAFFTSGATKAW